MPREKVEREHILLSLSPEFAGILRDLKQILYPNDDWGALSRTAEEAIYQLANQIKYQQAIKKLREGKKEIENLLKEVKSSSKN